MALTVQEEDLFREYICDVPIPIVKIKPERLKELNEKTDEEKRTILREYINGKLHNNTFAINKLASEKRILEEKLSLIMN